MKHGYKKQIESRQKQDFIPRAGSFDAELQTYQPAPNLVPQIWHEFEIDVRGDTYTVDLTNLTDGVKTRTTTLLNADPLRGIATVSGKPAGYIGLQSYPGAQLAFFGKFKSSPEHA